MTTTRRKALLFPDDIAALWTEERRRVEGPDAPEVTVDRVHDFTRWSKPTPPGAKRKHRYEDYPMPYPRGTRGRRQPAWHEDQEDDIRAFWHDRLPAARENASKIIEDAAYRTQLARETLPDLVDDHPGITIEDIEAQLLAQAHKDQAAAAHRKSEWASHI